MILVEQLPAGNVLGIEVTILADDHIFVAHRKDRVLVDLRTWLHTGRRHCGHLATALRLPDCDSASILVTQEQIAIIWCQSEIPNMRHRKIKSDLDSKGIPDMDMYLVV